MDPQLDVQSTIASSFDYTDFVVQVCRPFTKDISWLDTKATCSDVLLYHTELVRTMESRVASCKCIE